MGSTATLFPPHSSLAATDQKKDRLGVALMGLGYYNTEILAPALQPGTATWQASLQVLLPKQKIGKRSPALKCR